jgi:hypothetical protein
LKKRISPSEYSPRRLIKGEHPLHHLRMLYKFISGFGLQSWTSEPRHVEMKVKRKSFFILGMQQLQSQIQIPLGSLLSQP